MKRHLDTGAVLNWEGRSKRPQSRKPVTYWEEFVQEDAWYVDKLLEDVPEEEMRAACFDSDFSDGEDSHTGELQSDTAYEQATSTEEELSDTDSEGVSEHDSRSEDGAESDGGGSDDGGDTDEEEESVQWSSEGE